MIIKKIDEIERKANTDAASQPKPTPRTRRNMQPRRYQLTHDIYAICRRNPEGAHRTQVDRLRTLLLCAKALDRRKKTVSLNAEDTVTKAQKINLPSLLQILIHSMNFGSIFRWFDTANFKL